MYFFFNLILFSLSFWYSYGWFKKFWTGKTVHMQHFVNMVNSHI